MADLDAMKREAARAAFQHVQPGMRLGLGTGSTAKHFVDFVGQGVAQGLDVVCVPTSEATRRQAEGLGIRLSSLDDLGELDLTVDGADEIDGALNLIKGAGGAHLREKIVAAASRQMIVIADQTKVVKALGQGGYPLPVEIVRFSEGVTASKIVRTFVKHGLAAVARPRLTAKDERFVTDEGNFILDIVIAPGQSIAHPAQLASELSVIPGIVEHGLFIGLCSAAYVASENGILRLGAAV